MRNNTGISPSMERGHPVRKQGRARAGRKLRDLGLPCVSPGVFVSTNQLLVSDVEDTFVEPPDVAPGTRESLFECELGGTVRAVFTDDAGTEWRRSAEVGRDVRSVTVDIVVMTRGGVPAVPNYQVEDDLADMAERYAQADVRVNVGRITRIEMPFAYTNWFLLSGEPSPAIHLNLSSDAKSILNALPRTSGHIGIVYVQAPFYPYLEDAVPDQGHTPRTLLGFALAAHAFQDDRDFVGNVFISSSYAHTCFVPAHEIGHILTDDEHSDTRYNFMWNAYATNKGVKGPKRLDHGQIEKIRRSPYIR